MPTAEKKLRTVQVRYLPVVMVDKVVDKKRRGMVDMRKRFRGNAPVGAPHEVGGSGRTPQLYAGRPMYPDTPVSGKGGAEWGTEGEGKKE